MRIHARERRPRHIAERVDQCRTLLHSLEKVCPQEAIYLAREIGFTSGFSS